jgi:septal ring factor EnvC (AmiA/AmiB activator)
MLLLCSIVLFADDLDDKVRELQQLQSQLEKAEQKAKQTSQKKKQTESEIQRTASLKRLTDQNVQKYKGEEKVVRDSLGEVQRRLANANDRLNGLHNAQNSELNVLLRVDRSNAPRQISHRDHRYLQSLLVQHKRDTDIVNGYKVSLMQSEALHSSEASRINRNLRNENTKSKKFNTQIRTLTSETKKLSKEEQELQKRIAKLRGDAAELESLINRLMAESGRSLPSYQFTQIKIAWPLKGKIIRNFGQETKSYNTSVVSNGIDIAAREGTNVAAVDDGEVIFSDRYGGQGKMIIIDHKNGYFSLYGYNSDLLVNKGATVRRGQTIARSGMTGSASAASLHFELRKDGKAINPVPYFE